MGIGNISTNISCTRSGQIITITNGWPTTGISRLLNISFSISGLRTPISTKTSDSFQLYSLDSSDFIIDQITSLLSVTMLKGMEITSVSVSSSSNVVNDDTDITLSIRPPVPLSNGQQITITIPSEVIPPTKQNFKCNGADSLTTSLSCSINGATFRATIALRNSPSTANSSVITLRFSKAITPTSTKSSSEFVVVIRDALDYVISESITGSGGVLKVGTPAAVTAANITALDYRQQAFTTMTIQFVTTTVIPADGYLIVTFPRIYFQITQDNTTRCTSNLVKNENVTCEFLTQGSFKVSNIFPRAFAANQLVDFTINNAFIDVSASGQTDSWSVVTYTSDGFMIDRVRNILTLTFPCQSPCLTCRSGSPTTCLTCNDLTGNIVLHNQKCLSQCPNALYYDPLDLICKSCNSTCATCSFDNPNACTSCNKSSPIPYLDGQSCNAECNFGFFANKDEGECQKCSSNCLTCEGSASNCTSCSEIEANNLLSDGKCVSACPSGFTTNADKTACLKCDDNCRTCVSSTSQCTSCSSPLLLSQFDNTCVTECPAGRTIFNSRNNICETCDQKCQTCTRSKGFCTSCSENLNLWPSTGACIGECSANDTWVGFNGICTRCDAQCVTCVSRPDSCLSCQRTKFRYNFTCVDNCPVGFEADENRQCVINGLRCPFGYEPTPLGTACQLKAQICENGFRLNEAKDRCIPGPGNYAPFPLCFACLFLSFIVFISWLKYKTTLISSNIIGCMSLVETIGILWQLILAYEMGVYSTFSLTLIAALFLYGSNLFFAAVFLKNISGDQAFKYWSLTYRATYGTVVFLGSVVNFKVYRVIYGRFFNLDHFNAAFDEPETLFKPFTFVSVFSLVTTMLPMLVANIVGLVFIEFGYQVQMCCIELTIIELVMLGLMIYEKIKLKPIILRQQSYFKLDPKQFDQTNVMSSMIDDPYVKSTRTKVGTMKTTHGSDTDNLLGSIMLEEKKLVPGIQEYYERRRNLEKLISKIYQKDNSQTTVDIITRLQEEELMRAQQRNCRSFRDLREIDEDFADEGAGDPELQNFISAPVSPREKEMLHNPLFMGRVGEFKKACRQRRDQYDNVYAEGKPKHWFPMRDTKLISVKVQTNLLELLAIDDMTRVRASRMRRQDSNEERYIEENLDSDYASGLIDNVLTGFQDHTFRKQRRRLPKHRLAQIPNFDLTDITGDFELDAHGNSLIVRGKDGKLNDREGRKVNRNGYLIDTTGNVITQRGIVIFHQSEMDSDDEIPAPFCFEKKIQSLYKIEGINAYNKQVKKKTIEDKEDDIEREYRLLREKNTSHRSSVDSLMGETPSKYAKKNKRVMPGDEDGFLSKIVQPMQAKTKNELLHKSSSPSRNMAQLGNQRSSDHSVRNLGKTQASNAHVKSTSIDGGYDTAFPEDQSVKDLFFGPTGTQQSRNLQGKSVMGGKSSMQYQSSDMEKVSRMHQLKDTLGGTEEDQALKRHLAKFEASLLGRTSHQDTLKTPLAKRNLQRVYGKLQDRLDDAVDFHPAHRPSRHFDEDTILSRNADQTSTSFYRPAAKPPTSAIPDSRLKNLENIYLKSLNQDRRTASQMNKRLSKTQMTPHDLESGQNTGKYRPMMQHSMQETGVESSDQEERRMRQQLNQMQAILDKGQKINGQNAMASKVIPKGNKKLEKGGWL